MKVLTILLITLIIAGCNKKHDGSALNKSRKDLLINKKWQVLSISRLLDDGMTVDPDYYSKLPEYEQDDYYFFRWNLTYDINENKVRRPLSEEQLYDNGTWSLTQGDKYLELQSLRGFGHPIIQITDISDTELRFVWSNQDGLLNYILKPMQ
jgi:hypothetical protein